MFVADILGYNIRRIDMVTRMVSTVPGGGYGSGFNPSYLAISNGVILVLTKPAVSKIGMRLCYIGTKMEINCYPSDLLLQCSRARLVVYCTEVHSAMLRVLPQGYILLTPSVVCHVLLGMCISTHVV